MARPSWQTATAFFSNLAGTLRTPPFDYRIEAGWATVFGKRKHRDQIAALPADPNGLVRKACKEMLEMIDSSR